MRALLPLLLILLAATPPTVRAAPANPATPDGSVDLETVEDLALFFAEQSYRRLRVPVLLRLVMLVHGGPGRKEAIADLLADPPKADADGVVYPFGDGNDLSFAYDARRKTFTVWERIAKNRGRIGFSGLTGPEHAAALNARSSRAGDRGGADWGWDPVRDAISLYREYREPPADRERFYREVDRMIKTQLEWAKGRYLRETIAVAENLEPPASATATADDFTATLVLRHFSVPPAESQAWVKRYFRAWDRRVGQRPPRLISDRELPAGRRFHFFIHFEGARDNAEAVAPVEAVFRLIDPHGGIVFDDFRATVWREPAKPPGHVHIGVNNTFIALDPDQPPGDYRFEGRVCDATTERCVDLAHPFELLP